MSTHSPSYTRTPRKKTGAGEPRKFGAEDERGTVQYCRARIVVRAPPHTSHSALRCARARALWPSGMASESKGSPATPVGSGNSNIPGESQLAKLP